MGTDSYIFESLSRECYYFDRKWNLFTMPDDNTALDILIALDVGGGNVTADEVAYVCALNINLGLGKAGWNRAIQRFVEARPKGSFFSRSDHDFPDARDIIERDGYTVIPEDTY